jgi:hypothetical protein
LRLESAGGQVAFIHRAAEKEGVLGNLVRGGADVYVLGAHAHSFLPVTSE